MLCIRCDMLPGIMKDFRGSAHVTTLGSAREVRVWISDDTEASVCSPYTKSAWVPTSELEIDLERRHVRDHLIFFLERIGAEDLYLSEWDGMVARMHRDPSVLKVELERRVKLAEWENL